MSDMKITNLGDFEDAYHPICEIKHPLLGKTFYFRICTGISPKAALLGNIPITNPLLKAIADPNKPAEPAEAGAAPLEEMDPEVYLHRMAELAMIAPTYKEAEQYIKDDIWLLNEIARLASGISLLEVAGLSGTFQRGGQADIEKQLIEAGQHS